MNGGEVHYGRSDTCREIPATVVRRLVFRKSVTGNQGMTGSGDIKITLWAVWGTGWAERLQTVTGVGKLAGRAGASLRER